MARTTRVSWYPNDFMLEFTGAKMMKGGGEFPASKGKVRLDLNLQDLDHD